LWKKHDQTKARDEEAHSHKRIHEHYGVFRFTIHTKMAKLMNQTEERNFESRMRQIRKSA